MRYATAGAFRTTRDLDLGRHDDEQAATADFRLVHSVELDDYFSFAIQRTSKLDALLEGSAVRYRVTSEVDGRPFEQVTVDVGFADPQAFELNKGRGGTQRHPRSTPSSPRKRGSIAHTRSVDSRLRGNDGDPPARE